MKLKTIYLVIIVVFIFIGNGVFAVSELNYSAQNADSVAVVNQQAETTQKAKKKTDWMQIILGGSYLVGLLVLFPLVVYTNLNESLFDRIEGKKEKIKMRTDLTADQRNEMAAEILEKIESKLTSYTADDGTEMVTITKGKQARFMKKGIDFINTRLCPTNEELLERIDEFTEVYSERTKREFTGSKWILGCAIGLIVFMGIVDISMVFSAFTLIQLIGITFYFMASRTPRYVLDKRMKLIGSKGTGVVATIMSAILAGMAVKHYVSVNGGAWQRDHESELSSSAITLIILFVVAMFVAFMIALFGIFSFILNYSTSFLNPFKTLEKWYEEDFSKIRMAA
jgi:hypothetical protein